MDALEGFGAATEAIAIAGLVAVTYASTNLDNFAVLSAYSAKAGLRPLFINLTFVLVCLVVILVSIGIARATDTLIADKLRYLGVIPIAIGLYHLGKLLLPRSRSVEKSADKRTGLVGWTFYLGLALSLLANSTDNVIVLAPIFADLKLAFLVVCASAVIAVAIAMSSLASLVGNHPMLRAKVERISNWALPFLLIAIGLMILLDEPADAFAAVGGHGGVSDELVPFLFRRVVELTGGRSLEANNALLAAQAAVELAKL